MTDMSRMQHSHNQQMSSPEKHFSMHGGGVNLSGIFSVFKCLVF